VRRLLKRPAATLVSSALLASLLVVLVAAPAGAQTVSHHKKHLWHYWIAPVLLGSGVILVLALSFGYYWRVVRGK
jgi:hypothetical protein